MAATASCRCALEPCCSSSLPSAHGVAPRHRVPAAALRLGLGLGPWAAQPSSPQSGRRRPVLRPLESTAGGPRADGAGAWGATGAQHKPSQGRGGEPGDPGLPLVDPVVLTDDSIQPGSGAQYGSYRGVRYVRQPQQEGPQVVAEEVPLQPPAPAPAAPLGDTRRPAEAGGKAEAKGVNEPAGEKSHPTAALDAAGRWTVVCLAPAAVWGSAWLLTVGLGSVTYACLAAAASVAAGAFGSLAPAASAAAAAAAAGNGSAAAANAAAVAGVDWVGVAVRTAAGLAAGGPGREQVLQTLTEAGAGPLASWAAQTLLPALCAVASTCGAAAGAVHRGAPLLGALAQSCGLACGLGVVLILALPLRPFATPLLPRGWIPKAGPSPATLAALGVGGVACMVALLTGVQAAELSAPPLGPSARSAAAAAAAVSPLLAQHRAVLYGALAAAADVVLAGAVAVVAVGCAVAVWRRRAQQHASTTAGSQPAGLGSGEGGAVAGATGLERWVQAARWLAAGRLLVDLVGLAAVGSGYLSGTVSAVRVMGRGAPRTEDVRPSVGPAVASVKPPTLGPLGPKGGYRLFQISVPAWKDPGKDDYSTHPALEEAVAYRLGVPAARLPPSALRLVRKSFDARNDPRAGRATSAASLPAQDIPDPGYLDDKGELVRPWCPATRIVEHRENEKANQEAEAKKKAASATSCPPSPSSAAAPGSEPKGSDLLPDKARWEFSLEESPDGGCLVLEVQVGEEGGREEGR
ncbi:hypothetical protein HYH03_010755 [Edaphochlamys debaryana]|uniref:Uncharacterized protein n=1 Tax=Edaphochlamys debaryana TaxID=47281 RepID=A0A835XYN0_9CHLO|nr:hypothetical protein HYH03_010755 [Edaphochlamys debaryana]|eukprot:KAG2490836.1 hypothetical protein HYH03_010755 [Edaphochlamys debaryana]